MSLTVKEKEHWRERISRKIDQAKETLLVTNDPHYLETLRREAKTRALTSLGIAAFQADVERLKEEMQIAERKQRLAFRNMLALVRGVSIDDVEGNQHSEAWEVEQAVKRRQDHIERELLAADDLGKRLLQLDREKEELLDTVWLATSPTQIKELWATVVGVLSQEPTELQKEALAIQAMESEGK